MRIFLWLRDQPYVLLALTSLFWAGNVVVGRAVVDLVPPVLLAQIRWTAAFVLVLPFAWRNLQSELPAYRRHLWIIVILSFTGVSAYNTLLYWALHHTTAVNAALMQSSAPLLIGLWGIVLFREPVTASQVGGVLLSLLGVAAVISGGEVARILALSLNIGDLAVLVAVAAYALYSTLLRRRPAVSQLGFIAVTMGIGAALLAPLTALEAMTGPHLTSLTWRSVAALIYVAVFPSILAYLAFNRGVELVGANRAGPFFHLIPLFAAVLAIAFLGERPGLHHAIGALLIVGGVVLASRGPSQGGGNRVAPPRSSA